MASSQVEFVPSSFGCDLRKGFGNFGINRHGNDIHKDTSDVNSNLGVASLVQILEARFRQPNSGNNSSRSSPRSENGSIFEEQTRSSSYQEGNDGSSPSDHSAFPQISVAHLVKKLTSADNDNESCAYSPNDGAGQKAFTQVIVSPRIRGRQAFNDLLMQMERDRHEELLSLEERSAVSKFPQRGRVQSVLKLKLLQRAAQEEREHSRSPNLEFSRPCLKSTVRQLREKFSMGIEPGTAIPNNKSNASSPCNNSQNKSELLSSCQLTVDIQHQEAHSFEQQSISPPRCSISQTTEDKLEEADSSSDTFSQETSSESCSLDLQVSRESSDFLWQETGRGLTVDIQHQEVHSFEQQGISPSRCLIAETTEDNLEVANSSPETLSRETSSESCNLESQISRDSSDFLWEGTGRVSSKFYAAVNIDETMFSSYCDENEVTEEDEMSDDHVMDTDYDWFTDIARPRSYWEECRQARYQEVLSTDAKNELRQLLERGTVSNFLASDLCDRINQLMENRLQPNTSAMKDGKDKQQRSEQFIMSLETISNIFPNNNKGREKEHKDNGGVEVEREETNAANQEDHEADEYFDRSTMLSDTSSAYESTDWSYEDHVTGSDSEQTQSSNSNQCLQYESYDQETQHRTSSINCASVDMEFVMDMKRQMEQLQHEMLELRKSVNLCMKTQSELHEVMKQEVHSVSSEGKNELDKSQEKGKCCICYDKQIDSLLYRCGHKCTCLKCAHELQWSSGKCPMCCAPISNVVRPYM